MQQSRLMRSSADRMVAGVCGGIADYLGLDPVLVRLAFVILTLASGVGLWLYAILWLIMPSHTNADPEIRVLSEPDVEDAGSLKSRFSPAATIGILLILVGGFFVLNQMGGVPGFVWPLVLIAGGLYVIVRRYR